MNESFITDRDSHLARHTELLQPYAVPHDETEGLGRFHEEKEPADGDNRLRFVIDKGRIIYNEFFRRLSDKVQVMPYNRADYIPGTRLSHSIAVASLARDIASELGLNADLAEVIGLSHDLGHCGLGHEGERPLHDWAIEKSDGQIGFDHNSQSHRIVTILADQRDAATTGVHGLNLSKESIYGLISKDKPYNTRDVPSQRPSIEAQIVEQVDDIAHLARDVEDALNLGIISVQHFVKHPFFEESIVDAHGLYSNIRSRIISILKRLLKQETQQRLRDLKIETLSQVYDANEDIVRLPESAETHMKKLQLVLNNTMYQGIQKRDFNAAAEVVIRSIADEYCARPTTTIQYYEYKAERNGDECPPIRAICDFIARMTYQQLIRTAKSLGIPEKTLSNLHSIEWN